MKKSNTVQIGPRISPEAIEFYKKNFRNVSKGTAQIIEDFILMYKGTFPKLKGYFTRVELLHILDISTSGSIKVTQEVFGRKTKVNLKTIKNKLFLLPHLEYYVLEVWASAYWHGNHNKTDYAWIKELL